MSRFTGALDVGYTGELETGADDSSGDDGSGDDAAAGADAVDAIFGRRARGRGRGRAQRRVQPTFVQEAGVDGDALTNPAGPLAGKAVLHCNGAKKIVDWMVGNPLSAALAERWWVTQLNVGDYPQIKGNGHINGTSHAAAVMDRGVNLPAARDGWDITWLHSLQTAEGPLQMSLNLKYVSVLV